MQSVAIIPTLPHSAGEFHLNAAGASHDRSFDSVLGTLLKKQPKRE
jgi:hypothetical protein